MVSQVEMAIHELRADTTNERIEPTQAVTLKNKQDVIELKPNFYGIGVNLNKGWRRVKSWFRRGRGK